MDYENFRQRATIGAADGVEVRALVLSRQDGDRLLGADVFAHGVEPVWVEVSNGTDHPLTLLRAGADPDYFSPLEVSWSLHGGLLGAVTRTSTAISTRWHFPLGEIPPGRTRSGLLFTNPHLDVKLLNIDLVGVGQFVSLTLFAPIPDDEGNIRRRKCGGTMPVSCAITATRKRSGRPWGSSSVVNRAPMSTTSANR